MQIFLARSLDSCRGRHVLGQDVLGAAVPPQHLFVASGRFCCPLPQQSWFHGGVLFPKPAQSREIQRLEEVYGALLASGGGWV